MASNFVLAKLTSGVTGRKIKEVLFSTSSSEEIKAEYKKAKMLHDGVGKIVIQKVRVKFNKTKCNICKGDLTVSDGMYHCKNCDL